MINAVQILRARRENMSIEAIRRARAAWEAGESQVAALSVGALERLRIASVLPVLPDNDRINDRVRRLNGQPSELMCDLPQEIRAG